MASSTIKIVPITELGLIEAGDDLTGFIIARAIAQGEAIEADDVVVITSKVVSKAEGRMIPLSTVEPTRGARALAKVSGRDPRICELVMRHSKRVVAVLPTGREGMKFVDRIPDAFPVGREVVAGLFAKEPHMLMAELPNGLIVTDAGIDSSNVVGTENAILLPENPDQSCKRIRQEFLERTGKRVAVVLSDTDLRFQRFGSVDQAIGSWGIETVAGHFGQKDLYGKPKIGGVDAVTDMMSNAAALVMGNTDQAIPVAVIRGAKYRVMETGMWPIQVSMDEMGKGVIYNLWLDLKLWAYNNVLSV